MEPRTFGAGAHHVLYIAPQVRGHVPEHVIRDLRVRGLRIHRIGAAAYVHGAGHHLILGVWERRTPPPAWAGRLGSVSDGYLRRAERLSVAQRRRGYLRDGLGRFVARLPWYRVPPPRVYRFEPARLGWADEERRQAEQHNARVRLLRGLITPEAEFEVRAAWGNERTARVEAPEPRFPSPARESSRGRPSSARGSAP